jgi:3-deoxy-manno-octulosonate cytidylyltransferase (CMP-KDO synthetase)
MPHAVVVIPARWSSSRFPGKVLAPLGGRPLVQHVCNLAERAASIETAIVATDDERVAERVRSWGGRVELTRADHQSGTDRVAEVAEQLDADIVVGLQADEPFLDPADIDRLVAELSDEGGAPLATLSAPLENVDHWRDPNAVKVVTDAAGRALYFSRAPIPYPFGEGAEAAVVPPGVRLHVGVYGWRRDALLRFAAMPPSPLEQCERLEQLRALEAGWTIRVASATGAPFGIDTEEDLRRAEKRLSGGAT